MEYQRGTDHLKGGPGLTGSRVPQDGMTPLHWAAEMGHEEVVVALLAAEADKEARDQVIGGREFGVMLASG